MDPAAQELGRDQMQDGRAAERRSPLARAGYVRVQLWPFARRHRRWLIRGGFWTILVVACRLAFPWPLQGVLELAFSEKDSTALGLVPSVGDPELWLVGTFIAILLCQALVEPPQRLSFGRFSIGLVHDARSAALASLWSPAAEGERSRDPDEQTARVIGDSARVKAGLGDLLIRLTQSGLFFLGVCAMLCVIDVRLGLVLLAGGVVTISVALFGAAEVSNLSHPLRRKEDRLSGGIYQALVSDRSGDSSDLEAIVATSGVAEAKATRPEGLTIWAVHVTLVAASCTVVLLGLYLVRAGALQPGDMFTVLLYLLMVHIPTVRLSGQTVRLGRVLASAERLAEVLKRRDEQERDEAERERRAERSRLVDVS